MREQKSGAKGKRLSIDCWCCVSHCAFLRHIHDAVLCVKQKEREDHLKDGGEDRSS